MIRKQLTVVMAIGIALLFSFPGPVEAGTCQPVKAKGQAAKLATATLYAQADLKQTAKSMGGKVTQTTTNCMPGVCTENLDPDIVVMKPAEDRL